LTLDIDGRPRERGVDRRFGRETNLTVHRDHEIGAAVEPVAQQVESEVGLVGDVNFAGLDVQAGGLALTAPVAAPGDAFFPSRDREGAVLP
jgi:hypothetical protein